MYKESALLFFALPGPVTLSAAVYGYIRCVFTQYTNAFLSYF